MSNKAKLKQGRMQIKEELARVLFQSMLGTFCTSLAIVSGYNHPEKLVNFLKANEAELAGKSLTELKQVLAEEFGLIVPENSIAILYNNELPAMCFPYVTRTDGYAEPMPLYPEQYSAVLLAYKQGKAELDLL